MLWGTAPSWLRAQLAQGTQVWGTKADRSAGPSGFRAQPRRGLEPFQFQARLVQSAAPFLFWVQPQQGTQPWQSTTVSGWQPLSLGGTQRDRAALFTFQSVRFGSVRAVRLRSADAGAGPGPSESSRSSDTAAAFVGGAGGA